MWLVNRRSLLFYGILGLMEYLLVCVIISVAMVMLLRYFRPYAYYLYAGLLVIIWC
jgi:hypothetical protein